jgi:manganese transport protein
LVAIVPALFTIILFGEGSTTSLLILSQVVLSLQLSFAVIPLIMFTSDRRLMGEFVNPRWLKILAYAVATVIVGLNGWLLIQTFLGWLS